jgi:hypothetical protein
VGRFTLAIPPPPPIDIGAVVLDEDRVRDQVSAAEELMYVGHREPALVAAGAALEGALRVTACSFAGDTASHGALLEALLSVRAIDDYEYEILIDALGARDRLIHGFAPWNPDIASPERVSRVLEIAIRLLEPRRPTR